MTREELEIELAKIGWRIKISSNGLNDFIVNHLGEKTAFVISDEKLEIRHDIFGGSGNGNCHFELKHLSVRSGNSFGDGNTIEWVSICFSENNFIQFFNHGL